MPPADHEIDLEHLVREAISGVAVKAFARGITIASHIDNRLNCRVLGDPEALPEFLRRGLARTIEAGPVRQVALALWRGGASGGDTGPPVLLEVCRSSGAGEAPPTGLADAWAQPKSGAGTAPVCVRQSERSEAVLTALPCVPVAQAPPVAAKWGESFRGRSLLVVRDVLFDRARCAASLAVLGLDVAFCMSAERAIETARSDAGAGRPPDFLVLDIDLLGGGAVSLARRFRADPALSGARILLTGGGPKADAPPHPPGLFDAVLGPPMPWRRLMDALHDLAGAPAKDAGPAGGAIAPLTGRRVLIAEDVATNQVLLKAVLAPTGAEIEVVTDGAAVLERHAQAPADLILMDLQMPGMGGITAMRRLRALGGAAGAVPVVALTAYARDADRRRAMEAGMDAYLAKPIVVTELYDVLRRLLPEDENGVGRTPAV